MKTQLELGLQGRRTSTAIGMRRRMPTARWWFERMHQVVNDAIEWTSPVARPQQIYLELKPAAYRNLRRSGNRAAARHPEMA